MHGQPEPLIHGASTPHRYSCKQGSTNWQTPLINAMQCYSVTRLACKLLPGHVTTLSLEAGMCQLEAYLAIQLLFNPKLSANQQTKHTK
jgi:hypothetical protein